MRSIGLTLLALFLVCVAGVQGQRSASSSGGADAASRGGSASATVHARTTNGEVRAYVESNAGAFATAENQIAEAVATAVANVAAGGDATAEATAAAEACATAIAKAYASVTIDIVSTGDSSACAEGLSTAYAAATAFAQAYAQALAVACDTYGNCGTGSADVESIASGTAEAFAVAYNEGCVRGTGTVWLETVSFAQSITEVYALALADAFGAVYDGGATADASVIGTSDVVSDNFAASDSTATVAGDDARGTAVGDAVANGAETPVCDRAFAFCCTSTGAARTGKCRCPKPKCNMISIADNIWQVKSKKINLGNRKSPDIFEKGYTCICA